MPSSCKELRAALATCLAESDCILLSRHTPQECLSKPLYDELPTKCQQLARGLSDCKRGLVDMRKRFRGNMPFALDIETAAQKKGQMYTTGGPSLASVIREERVGKDGKGKEKEKEDEKLGENQGNAYPVTYPER